MSKRANSNTLAVKVINAVRGFAQICAVLCFFAVLAFGQNLSFEQLLLYPLLAIALLALLFARFSMLKNRRVTLESQVLTLAAELREANRQLIDANCAKSASLSNMSHELRTPLNAVIGFAQLMRRDSKLTTEQRENLAIIQRSGENLLGLINGVLSIPKIEGDRLAIAETFVEPRKVVGLAADQPIPRVLIVDDLAENRLLLSKLLLSIGFQVNEAANGQEAVEIWSKWQPDLIFMDLRMPILDGHGATREIRLKEKQIGLKSSTKIIALTANAFEHERGTIIEDGANDFVAKPFREGTIFGKIAEHLGTRFIYENTDEPKPDNAQIKTHSNALSPERFAFVAPEILASLEHALRLGDDAAASVAAGKLQTIDPELSTAIQRAVKDFDFDLVLQAMSKGGAHVQQRRYCDS